MRLNATVGGKGNAFAYLLRALSAASQFVDSAHAPEIPLSGGMSTAGVVRVGNTVRRPLKPDSENTRRLLLHLERCGFSAAPRYLGSDFMGREVFDFVEGYTHPNNGLALPLEGVREGARIVRRIHDLTEDTEFSSGGEVACHPNLSQPNFVFQGPEDLVPIAIIDWDGTEPGTRLRNFADFLWAYVHPGTYGEGEPAARMLEAAVEAYGWSGSGLTDEMIVVVRRFLGIVQGDVHAEGWGSSELAYLERNPELFRRRIG